MRGASDEPRYVIAGQTVTVDKGLPLPSWEAFFAPSAGGAPICRIRRGRWATLYGVGSASADHPVVHVLRAEQALLLGDADCSRLTVCGDQPHEGLLLAGLSARLALLGTVLMHGALVDAPTVGGVLFIGASGVGKSTQAELWRERSGGQILNGDRVLVHMEPSRAHAVGYGSPWAGSSPYRVCREACIVLAVELTRARKGMVRRLSAEEAAVAWLGRTLIPGWNAAMSAMSAAAAETVLRLASLVPTVTLAVPDGRPTEGLTLLESYLRGEKNASWSIPTVTTV